MSSAELLVQKATALQLKLGVAESCTGGRVAAAITAIPGASVVFEGGVVTYSNLLKTRLLGVPEGLLAEAGAVSEAVAIAMAEGAIRALGVDVAAAITGIAGPGGGTPEKPVGLVFIAVAYGDGQQVERCHFSGTREMIQHAATQKAIELMLKIVDYEGQ